MEPIESLGHHIGLAQMLLDDMELLRTEVTGDKKPLEEQIRVVDEYVWQIRDVLLECGGFHAQVVEAGDDVADIAFNQGYNEGYAQSTVDNY